jgi:L-amino acid N-acyltransferase YncA
MGFELSGVWTDVGRKFDRYWDVAVWQRAIRLD